MADNLRKYTTQEVLNKVYTDSSGITIGSNSQTTKETLNAVFDTTNNRLQVALEGGTISGDVTISGDLTVEGSSTNATYDEIIQGALQITASNAFIDVTDTDSSLNVKIASGDSIGSIGTSTNHPLSIRTNSAEVIHLTSAGLVGIGHTPTAGQLSVLNSSASIPSLRLQNNAGGGGFYMNQNAQLASTKSAFTVFSGDAHIAGGTSLMFLNMNSATSTAPVISIDNNGLGKSIYIDHDTSGTDATDVTAMHIDFDRTDPGSGTAAHNDIGIDLDVNSSSKGTSTVKGMDIDVVGAGTGTQVATGLDINVSGGDTNRAIKVQTTAGYNSFNVLQITDDPNVGISYNTTDSLSIRAGQKENIRLTDGTTTFSGDVQITDTTTSSTTEGGYLRLASNDGAAMASGHRLGVIEFAGAVDASNTITSSAKIQAMTDATWSGSEHGTVLDFYTSDGSTALGSGNPMMRITAGGRVGIGEDNPSQALHVSGNVTAGIYYGTSLHSSSGDLTLTSNNSQTKIFLDEAPGAIDFYPANSIRFKLDDNSRISLANNTSFDGGTSNTVFGRLIASANNILSGSNYNVFIGEEVASDGSLSEATNNVIIGYQAGEDLTTADSSTFVGFKAGKEHSQSGSNTAIGSNSYAQSGGFNSYSNTFVGAYSGGGDWASASYNNVAIGANALVGALDGSHSNVAVGLESLRVLTSGNSNVSVGTYSGYDLNTGNQNTLVGHSAGENVTDGDNNVLLGYRAGYTANFNNSIGIGYRSLYNNTADNNVAIGYDAGFANTSGAGNTAVGHQSLQAVTTGNDNVALGSGSGSAMLGSTDSIAIGKDSLNAMAGDTTTNTDNMGFRNIGIGTDALGSLNGTHVSAFSNDNIAIGFQAGLAGSRGSAIPFSGNIAIGSYALDATGSNDHSGTIAIGHQALTDLTSGTNNIAIGYQAMKENQTGGSNTVIGHGAMNDSNNQGGDHNVFVGTTSGAGGWDGAASSNTAIGSFSFGGGAKTAAAINNVAVGRDSLYANTSGHSNVALGKSAGDAITTMSETTLVGYSAGGALTTGTGQNVAIGSEALSTATSVQFATAVGYKALQGISASAADDNQNTGIGWSAGYNISTGVRNTAIGAQALIDNQTASDNTAVGQLALENTTGAENTAIGRMAGNTNTSGINNVFVGKQADSSGNFNYQTALGWNATTEGNYAVAIGMYGIKKFKTARITLSEFSSGNNTAGKSAHTNALFTIPSKSFISKVVVKVVTLSSNSAHLMQVVFSSTLDEAVGDTIASPTTVIAASGMSTGYKTRSSVAPAADSSIQLGTTGGTASVGDTYISQDEDLTNDSTGWATADVGFYIAHAGNNDNSAPDPDPVIDILVEYY